MKNKFKLTVEQLTVFFKMVVLDKKNTGITEANVKEALEKVYALTTLEQVKQLASDHNASVVQWIPIKGNTSSVINRENKECIALMKDGSQELCVYERGDFIDGNGFGARCNEGITHIALKPDPPKENK